MVHYKSAFIFMGVAAVAGSFLSLLMDTKNLASAYETLSMAVEHLPNEEEEEDTIRENNNFSFTLTASQQQLTADSRGEMITKL